MATDTTKWTKKKDRLLERRTQLEADLLVAQKKVVTVERKLADTQQAILACDAIILSGQVPA